MPTHNLLNRVSPGSTAFLVRHADALLYGAVIVLLVAPFFVFDTIPLYDLPNHIARQHLLFDDATPGIESYYEAHWRLIPNLALEGAVFLLHHVLPIDLSVRILLALTVAQLLLGTLALHYALFGRCGRLPLAAALFAYTGPLLLDSSISVLVSAGCCGCLRCGCAGAGERFQSPFSGCWPPSRCWRTSLPFASMRSSS